MESAQEIATVKALQQMFANYGFPQQLTYSHDKRDDTTTKAIQAELEAGALLTSSQQIHHFSDYLETHPDEKQLFENLVIQMNANNRENEQKYTTSWMPVYDDPDDPIFILKVATEYSSLVEYNRFALTFRKTMSEVSFTLSCDTDNKIGHSNQQIINRCKNFKSLKSIVIKGDASCLTELNQLLDDSHSSLETLKFDHFDTEKLTAVHLPSIKRKKGAELKLLQAKNFFRSPNCVALAVEKFPKINEADIDMIYYHKEWILTSDSWYQAADIDACHLKVIDLFRFVPDYKFKFCYPKGSNLQDRIFDRLTTQMRNFVVDKEEKEDRFNCVHITVNRTCFKKN